MIKQPLLTIEQVAQYYGVPVRTLHQWRYLGIGPRASKIGRHLRYRVEDVEAYVDEKSSAGSAA